MGQNTFIWEWVKIALHTFDPHVGTPTHYYLFEGQKNNRKGTKHGVEAWVKTHEVKLTPTS